MVCLRRVTLYLIQALNLKLYGFLYSRYLFHIMLCRYVYSICVFISYLFPNLSFSGTNLVYWNLNLCSNELCTVITCNASAQLLSFSLSLVAFFFWGFSGLTNSLVILLFYLSSITSALRNIIVKYCKIIWYYLNLTHIL